MTGVAGEYTPGPWRAERDGCDWNVWSCPHGYAEGDAVAEGVQSSFDDDGCEEANARLIAAAPELLEALEGLVEGFPDDGEYELVQGGYTPNKLTVARAAIARARGANE